MILGQANLRRNHHRGLNRELRVFISKNDLRRRDLLHRKLRQSTLWSRQLVMVTAATTASHYFLGDWKRVRIWRRSDQRYGLMLLNALHNLMAKHGAAEDQTQSYHVNHRRANQPIGAVIIELSPDCLRTQRSLF